MRDTSGRTATEAAAYRNAVQTLALEPSPGAPRPKRAAWVLRAAQEWEQRAKEDRDSREAAGPAFLGASSDEVARRCEATARVLREHAEALLVIERMPTAR